MIEIPTLLSLLLFGSAILILMLGFPVAFCLSGTAILFATIAFFLGYFDYSFFELLPERLYGSMTNETLIAIPLFIFMGIILERSKVSENLLETMGLLFGRLRGGLGISICLVGGLLAASTGIVGATVVTMGLLSLPVMLKYKYSPSLSSGVICASGTLGQIIPPSLILVILGDVISSANQQAQLSMMAEGKFDFKMHVVSVGDLFVGAIMPGIFLVTCYILYIVILSIFRPKMVPSIVAKDEQKISRGELILKVIYSLLPPLFLIVSVLGSILLGYATPTEAASVGCIGGIILAFINRQLSFSVMRDVVISTAKVNCMVFVILIGSNFFSLVFRGLEGDEAVSHFLLNMHGGANSVLLLVMLVIFVLGFFLDFFEITFVVVPIIAPILIQLGFDPLWLAIMIALNLQTSFLTPPFGFALFYLRGVAPPEVTTKHIYLGVVPFILIQVFVIGLIWYYPEPIYWLLGDMYTR